MKNLENPTFVRKEPNFVAELKILNLKFCMRLGGDPIFGNREWKFTKISILCILRSDNSNFVCFWVGRPKILNCFPKFDVILKFIHI